MGKELQQTAQDTSRWTVTAMLNITTHQEASQSRSYVAKIQNS